MGGRGGKRNKWRTREEKRDDEGDDENDDEHESIIQAFADLSPCEPPGTTSDPCWGPLGAVVYAFGTFSGLSRGPLGGHGAPLEVILEAIYQNRKRVQLHSPPPGPSKSRFGARMGALLWRD